LEGALGCMCFMMAPKGIGWLSAVALNLIVKKPLQR